MSKLKVFVSYAHEDASYKNELINHVMNLLKGQNLHFVFLEIQVRDIATLVFELYWKIDFYKQK